MCTQYLPHINVCFYSKSVLFCETKSVWGSENLSLICPQCLAHSKKLRYIFHLVDMSAFNFTSIPTLICCVAIRLSLWLIL
jgi:hypothetical protein